MRYFRGPVVDGFRELRAVPYAEGCIEIKYQQFPGTDTVYFWRSPDIINAMWHGPRASVYEALQEANLFLDNEWDLNAIKPAPTDDTEAL